MQSKQQSLRSDSIKFMKTQLKMNHKRGKHTILYNCKPACKFHHLGGPMEWGLLAASGSVAWVILTFLPWNLADSNICQRECHSPHGKRLTFKSFYTSMRVVVCRSRLQFLFLRVTFYYLWFFFLGNVSRNAFFKIIWKQAAPHRFLSVTQSFHHLAEFPLSKGSVTR